MFGFSRKKFLSKVREDEKKYTSNIYNRLTSFFVHFKFFQSILRGEKRRA